MKYLLCLVAMLLLCLSPNPSFGQPDTFEFELDGDVATLQEKLDGECNAQKYIEENGRNDEILKTLYNKCLEVFVEKQFKLYKEILESKNYEKYEEMLGTFFRVCPKYNTDKKKHTEVFKKNWENNWKVFLSKVKDYMDGLIAEKPEIVEELTLEIAKLNKEISEAKSEVKAFQVRSHTLLLAQIDIGPFGRTRKPLLDPLYDKLGALDAILYYHSLGHRKRDNPALGRLDSEQQEFLIFSNYELSNHFPLFRAKARANSPVSKMEPQHTAKAESQGKSGSSPKSLRQSGSSPKSLRKSGSSPKSLRQSGSSPKSLRKSGSSPKSLRQNRGSNSKLTPSSLQ